jgi:hypothetical protein
MMLLVGDHVYSTLNPPHVSLIAEPSGVANLDAMILMVGVHVYSTLNSRMFLIPKPQILMVGGHVYST